MSSNKDMLMDLFAAVGAFVLPAVAPQLAVGVAISKILNEIQEERKEISQSVVLAELRHVDSYEKLAQDPKGFVAKAARFHQAAIVGSAYKNLRLLAPALKPCLTSKPRKHLSEKLTPPLSS